MCVGDRNTGTFEEILAFFLCKELLPMAYIQWEYRLMPINGKPLGCNTLRSDTQIRGLRTFPNGLSLAVKGQNEGGTTDEKIPKFLLHDVPHYPNPIILWFAGAYWFTDRGNEYYVDAQKYKSEQLIAIIRGTDDLIEYLRDLAKIEVAVGAISIRLQERLKGL